MERAPAANTFWHRCVPWVRRLAARLLAARVGGGVRLAGGRQRPARPPVLPRSAGACGQPHAEDAVRAACARLLALAPGWSTAGEPPLWWRGRAAGVARTSGVAAGTARSGDLREVRAHLVRGRALERRQMRTGGSLARAREVHAPGPAAGGTGVVRPSPVRALAACSMRPDSRKGRHTCINSAFLRVCGYGYVDDIGPGGPLATFYSGSTTPRKVRLAAAFAH